MFYWIRYIIFWAIWWKFADKKRWRELFSVAIFAALLGTLTDHLFHDYYKLWSYVGQPPVIKEILNDIGIYVVVTYLFIQWLPQERGFLEKFLYFFFWTLVSIFIEWFHLAVGKIEHHQWWNLWYSYLADWLLLWIFYKIHQVFRYERLSE